jgi:glycosyltransferase involved in cell wall biosynthesis
LLSESASIHGPKRTRAGLVIPTSNAGDGWPKCLAAVRAQSCIPERLLVVDSASTDRTVEWAKGSGFEVLPIARSEFNHGGTRQRPRSIFNATQAAVKALKRLEMGS